MRPSLEIDGASSALHIPSESIVADIMRILRSGRMSLCDSLIKARARSLVRLRSWNSSKITTLMPSRVGSETRILVIMPSVTTSTRVRGEAFLSKRMLYPTVSPTGSPISDAILSATWRAARRLGSSIRIFPSLIEESTVRGSTVDFPAPGGAVTTRHPCSASIALTWDAMPLTGRPETSSFIMKLLADIVC